jgi:hypothetical protein
MKLQGGAVPRFILAAIFVCWTPFALAQGAAANAAAGASASVAGRVALVEGDVRFYDKSQQSRRPKLRDAVYEGDFVFTGKDGEVHLDMEDGGYIGVRPSTRMHIANYKAEGGLDDESVIGLLEGSFRSITGWIGKLGRKKYQINTPTVTIGVRGTEHEPRVIPEGSSEGEPGTYDRVHVGETVMQTPRGAVNVGANQAGFMPLRGGVQPRVLERIPAFFRPTRHEARFQGQHQRIHQRLEGRRQDRIKQIQERRRHPATPRSEQRPQQPRAAQEQPRRGQPQNQPQQQRAQPREQTQSPQQHQRAVQQREQERRERMQQNRSQAQREVQERRREARQAGKTAPAERREQPDERKKKGERGARKGASK